MFVKIKNLISVTFSLFPLGYIITYRHECACMSVHQGTSVCMCARLCVCSCMHMCLRLYWQVGVNMRERVHTRACEHARVCAISCLHNYAHISVCARVIYVTAYMHANICERTCDCVCAWVHCANFVHINVQFNICNKSACCNFHLKLPL